MTRAEGIIADAEKDYGKTLDVDWDGMGDYLCDDDHCRHSECECWEMFADAVASQLAKQDDEPTAEDIGDARDHELRDDRGTE